MKNKKLDLDMLSRELKQVPQIDQGKIKGGGSVLILSGVSIVGDPWDGGGGWGSDGDPFGDDPVDDSYTGGGGTGGGWTPSDEPQINDPDCVYEDFKNYLEEQKEVLDGIVESGNVPAGFTVEDFQSYLDRIEQMLETLHDMETNGVAYRFEVGAGESAGETSYDTDTGEIVIRVNNAEDTGLIAHEVYHVQQIMNGELGFDENGNVTGLTIEDEVAAFQVQYEIKWGARAGEVDWDGDLSSGWEVTEEWLLEKFPIYEDLPSEGNGGGSSGSAGSSGD